MLFARHPVVVRGGGDLATGVVARLHRSGFPVVVLELARPLAIRRTVAVASAVVEGEYRVEDLQAVRADSPRRALETARTGRVAVLVEGGLPDFGAPLAVVVDARLAKRNLDTSMNDAGLVIGLGPGFTAGVDCHAVIETMRGHHLGRVLWRGEAATNTGVPGMVGGASVERVVRASRTGALRWKVSIGDHVAAGAELGDIEGNVVQAHVSGVVRGLILDGPVERGMKIADVDPRADRTACFEISDKSLAVGGGVLEAVMTSINAAS